MIPRPGFSLSGTFFQPDTGEMRAGIVMVHGSGPGARERLYPWKDVLIDSGFAVLVYDKRGSGKSGGSWITASLEDLAADARSVADWMRNQGGFDGEVGFWGISQGGWVLPELGRESSASFLIVVTGGGMDPEEVERHQYRTKLDGAGVTGSQRAEAEQLVDRYFRYLGTGKGYDELMSDFEDHSGESWLTALGIERVVPGPKNQPNWSWVANLSARERVALIEVPTLVLVGEDDPLQPVAPTVEAWCDHLTRSDANRVVVVEDAGHGIQDEPHGGSVLPAFSDEVAKWFEGVESGISMEDGKCPRRVGPGNR